MDSAIPTSATSPCKVQELSVWVRMPWATSSSTVETRKRGLPPVR